MKSIFVIAPSGFKFKVDFNEEQDKLGLPPWICRFPASEYYMLSNFLGPYDYVWSDLGIPVFYSTGLDNIMKAIADYITRTEF